MTVTALGIQAVLLLLVSEVLLLQLVQVVELLATEWVASRLHLLLLLLVLLLQQGMSVILGLVKGWLLLLVHELVCSIRILGFGRGGGVHNT